MTTRREKLWDKMLVTRFKLASTKPVLMAEPREPACPPARVRHVVYEGYYSAAPKAHDMIRVGQLTFSLHNILAQRAESEMGWEARRGGRRFYYRARRLGDRVVKEYVGGGERGRLAAEADEAARRVREQAELQRVERQRPMDDLAATMNEFDQLVNQVVTCHLLSARWKQHHRQWRSTGNGSSHHHQA